MLQVLFRQRRCIQLLHEWIVTIMGAIKLMSCFGLPSKKKLKDGCKCHSTLKLLPKRVFAKEFQVTYAIDHSLLSTYFMIFTGFELAINLILNVRCATSAGEYIDPSLKQGLGQPAITTHYTFKELKSGTNNFNSECKVDFGELGLLYKAVLSANEIVAVKRATRESHQSHTDFQKGMNFDTLGWRPFCIWSSHAVHEVDH